MPQTLTINTFQNVRLSLNIQIIGLRILAFLVDFFILISAWFGLLFFYAKVIQHKTNWTDINEESISVFLLVTQLPLYFYSFLTEFIFNGQTFGKMLCGIKVVKINGYQCGFIEYFMRWLFRIIDIYPFFILVLFFGEYGYIGISLIGIPAVITIAISNQGQRLGDIISGTTVVKIKNKTDLSITILKELHNEYKPTFQNVIRLSDNDMRIIKNTYEQAIKNGDHDTLQKLRTKVEQVSDIKSTMNTVDFLDVIIKDFNFYTREMT